MKKFSKNAILLLACLLLNGITNTFIYTYLLAYILDISSNGIVNVAIFYLVLHVTMTLLSWIMAPIFKKFNQSLSLKLGMIFKFLFVVIVVYLGDAVVQYVYIIAICNAISEIMFWGGANTLQTVVTEKNNLSLYISLTKIFSTIIGFVVPIVMGFGIDKIGMSAIATAMVVVVVTQLILSMFLSTPIEVDNTKLHYKAFLSTIKTQYPKTKHIYWNQLFYGFCTNMSMIILYYTVITFGSNISIGIFSAIASILSISILALYNLKKKVWSSYFTSILASVMVAIGVVAVLVSLNRFSLTLFYVCWYISIVIPETVTNATRLGITKREDLQKYHVENVTISEIYLNIGRVIGEVLLLTMGLVANPIFDIVCLCCTTIIVALYFVHSSMISRRHLNHEK